MKLMVVGICAFGALAALLVPRAGHADAAFHVRPTPGERMYRYDVREFAPDSTKGYRTDFRLATSDKGVEVAELIKSQSLLDGKWTQVTVDPTCAAALHARNGELASVKLSPLTPDEVKLGDAFMAACAPPGLFFPVTDILNAVLIQSSDNFHIDQLDKAGASAPFGAFSTSLSRSGIVMNESSGEGTIALISLHDGEAVVDWKPSPAKLELQEGNVSLSGTEHFAWRLVIDAQTGVLERADALYDDLDLVVELPNLPVEKRPHVAIRREVSIERTDVEGK